MHNAHNVIPDALRESADAGARLGALRTFTRDQVVWLISRAFESGLTYGAEQNRDAGYADGWRDATDEQVERALSSLSAACAVPPFNGRETADWATRRQRRADADALARTSRESDYAGGPLSLDDAGWPEVTGDGAAS